AQTVKSAPSTEHWNVPSSLLENEKDSGPPSSVATGGVVSTVHCTLAAVSLALPAALLVTTDTICDPSPSPLSDRVPLPAENGQPDVTPSTVHAAVWPFALE